MKKKLFTLLCIISAFIFSLILVAFFGCDKSSGQPSLQPEKLQAPRNLLAERKIVTWDAVENATGYTVVFENTEYKVNECKFDVSFYDIPGTYTIEVMALGDGKSYYDSDYISTSVVIKEILKSGYDEQGFKYVLLDDGSGYSVEKGNANLEGDIVIPEYFCDLPVKRIANGAFVKATINNDCFSERDCNTITTGIKLPAHLEIIGSNAFANMVRLKEIVIPDSVTFIGGGAFRGCTHMTKAVLPSGLKEIPNRCFENTALAEINIPDTVEIIGKEAFATPCGGTGYKVTSGKFTIILHNHIISDLSSITIPASVKQIGEKAFCGRLNLKNITFEAIENIEEIYPDAFDSTLFYESQPDGFICYEHMLLGYKWELSYDIFSEMPESRDLPCIRVLLGAKGAAALEDFVKTPDGISNIIQRSLLGQKNLTKIIISDGVKTIERNAFKDCVSLTDILLPSSLEYINHSAFYNCPSLSNIYYSGDSDAFEALILKSKITFGEATVYFYSETEPSGDGNFWHYVDGNPTPWN